MNSDCDAFNYVNNVCKLLRSELLFKDDTTQTEVYVLISTSPGNSIKYLYINLYRVWRAIGFHECNL